MRPQCGNQGAGETFVSKGWSNWKDKSGLKTYVGGVNSGHNQSYRQCVELMNRKQHVDIAICRQSDKVKEEYRIQLTAVIDCLRFLLRQGLAFRGHDESKSSSNRGNFLELLTFLGDHNEAIGQVFKQARGNLQLTSSDIQKDIINASANETTKAIISDIGDEFFTVLIDESRDISVKEQMAVVLHYVDTKGCVIERFLNLVHVSDTSALSLKESFESLLAKHGLSLSRNRGQGYDGASNMRGEFNGLKSLILKENQCAFYVHCFAHQIHLALVAIAKDQIQIASFFNLVASLTNVVGASCKRRDILREKQLNKVVEALEKGQISSGRGLNQELGLKRAVDIRWGSHYGTLLNLIAMFSSIIEVLEIVENDDINSKQRAEACALSNLAQTFEFAFCLHLMKSVLGITNEISKALQRQGQDIINAMALVGVSKQRLQKMRENGWDSLLGEVSLFCDKHSLIVLGMNDLFVVQGRSRRKAAQVSNLHHFQVELFYQVIDRQLHELNNRFTEMSTELLLCVACLSPRDSSVEFNKEKLVQYPLKLGMMYI